VKKPREELMADGSSWIGEGPTYVVFTSSGNVSLEVHGEKAEHRALRKNFTDEIEVGNVTLTFRDFAFRHQGVPTYSESLATLVNSIVHSVNDKKTAEKLSKQLSRVLVAAWMRANEAGGNDHARFRSYVIDIAKQLGRVPTQSEIRQALFPDTPPREIKRLCDENGLGWLPSGGVPGRPKKTAR
jgi:hypothetical protein